MLTFADMKKTGEKLTGIDAVIARNIDRFISESGMSRKALAEKLHFETPNMVSQYRHGHKAAGKNIIARFSKVLGKKEEEFYAPEYIHPKAGITSATYVSSARSSDASGQPLIVREQQSPYFSVPIVDAKIAAGPPALVTGEQIIDVAFIHRRILKKKDPRDLICTFVKGDSMEPVLRDGAIVCIDTKARPEGKKVPPSTIWAMRKDDGVVVKYLQIRDSTMVLVSENKAYQVELVKDPEAIIGRVVWAWQNY